MTEEAGLERNHTKRKKITVSNSNVIPTLKFDVVRHLWNQMPVPAVLKIKQFKQLKEPT